MGVKECGAKHRVCCRIVDMLAVSSIPDSRRTRNRLCRCRMREEFDWWLQVMSRQMGVIVDRLWQASGTGILDLKLENFAACVNRGRGEDLIIFLLFLSD